MKSVILDSNNGIMGIVDSKETSVEVAGAVTSDGSPVNVRRYRLSRSKMNLDRLSREEAEYATKHDHHGRVFYTLN